MFYLPKGWVPYWAEWLLSFPRAPLGSVSIQAWGLACAAVVLLASDAIAAMIALVVGAGVKEKTPVPVPAAVGEKETKKQL